MCRYFDSQACLHLVVTKPSSSPSLMLHVSTCCKTSKLPFSPATFYLWKNVSCDRIAEPELTVSCSRSSSHFSCCLKDSTELLYPKWPQSVVYLKPSYVPTRTSNWAPSGWEWLLGCVTPNSGELILLIGPKYYNSRKKCLHLNHWRKNNLLIFYSIFLPNILNI